MHELKEVLRTWNKASYLLTENFEHKILFVIDKIMDEIKISAKDWYYTN